MNNTTEFLEGLKTAIFAALIDGLRIKDKSLNEKCSSALLATGKGAVPYLTRAADDRRTKAAHRQRLCATIARIEKNEQPDKGEVECLMEALRDGLRVFNVRVNTLATDALRHLGEDSVDHLIARAIIVWKRPGYCERPLLAAEQIGKPDVKGFMNLSMLMGHSKPKVRNVAMRMFQRGPKDSVRYRQPAGPDSRRPQLKEPESPSCPS